MTRLLRCGVALALLVGRPVWAGPQQILGPPPPVPPEVIARDEAGRVTVRAVRLPTPVKVDGRLDESFYATLAAMSDFVQVDPKAGDPATEKTEVWVLFDADNIYVAARCWDTHPERMIADEMRRDNNAIAQNENMAFLFDTFYDRRNGFDFETNLLGARLDAQITNEGNLNSDWNTVWEVAVGRFDRGWTLELRVPFKSLRYRPQTEQIWGFQARRINKWKNEISYLSPVTPGRAQMGIFQASKAATLVGLEAPPHSLNLELKPYAAANLSTDVTASPPVSNRVGKDVGLDVKYAVTQNLTADLTLNTDFAQAEADEQQINLTRFNLSFPEVGSPGTELEFAL